MIGNRPNAIVEYLSAIYVKSGGDPAKADEWMTASRASQSPLEEKLYVSLRYSKKSPPTMKIDPQFKVGMYYLDFLCTLDSKRVGVEVDGHDFHEKTKEQAQHDKSRDRFILAQGIPTLRFTGSEIYADPDGCAEEVFQLLTSHSHS